MKVGLADFGDDGQIEIFVPNPPTPNSVPRNLGKGSFQDATLGQRVTVYPSSGDVIVWNSTS
jgi:hypothetical protein